MMMTRIVMMLDLHISRVGVQVHVLFLQGLSFSTCHDLVVCHLRSLRMGQALLALG